jgi:hypothetical protein
LPGYGLAAKSKHVSKYTAPSAVASRVVNIKHAGMNTAEDREHLLGALSDDTCHSCSRTGEPGMGSANLRILYDDDKFAQRFRASGCNLFVYPGCHETN